LALRGGYGGPVTMRLAAMAHLQRVVAVVAIHHAVKQRRANLIEQRVQVPRQLLVLCDIRGLRHVEGRSIMACQQKRKKESITSLQLSEEHCCLC
jgi:hypothetical protein